MDNRFLKLLDERVLFFDGSMGARIQASDLTLEDYDGHENCVDVLVRTQPDFIRDIHRGFFEIGCDVALTNTFGANKIVLSEFGIQAETFDLNKRATEIAKEAAKEFDTPDKPRFVFGSIGPGTRLVTLRQTDWDTMLDSYTEQARGLLAGGVDGFVIETCQDILQSKIAICACTDAMNEAGRLVPICCTVTIETTGTMLVGTEITAAIVALQAYDQVQVIGINCATGPQEMSEHVRRLAAQSDRYLLVQPNAGLPQLVDGKPYYALTPDELARWLKEFVEVDGVNCVGGCCGTLPEHLDAVIKAIGTRPPKNRTPKLEPSASSVYQAAPFRQDNAVMAVGERTNANGSKKFRELLAAEDHDGIVQMAKEQVQHGSHMIDVCTAYVGRDEVRDMSALISRFATDVTVPLVIDSTEVPVLEAALKLAGGKCVINSINLEAGEERLDIVCQMAKRYGAALVALTIDEEGMAKTADRKVEVARRIHDLAVNRHGVHPSDLIFDPLTFTICTGNEDDRRLGLETLDALARIKDELPGVHTLLGLSNISFGVKPPARRVLNSVYLHHAMERGLDAAILHAVGIVPLFKIDEQHKKAAEDLVFDRRRDGYDPLMTLLDYFEDHTEVEESTDKVPKTVEERLKHRIIDGNRTGIEDDLEEAMLTYPPLAIINDLLLDGMKVVGDLFGAGQMQLPFVLQSAETMKRAVGYLEPFMEKVEGKGKGSIVLATVSGDVHDIGKNLVDIVLTNNGYTVHNLGIKQPISSIIDAWKQHEADAIGLSGLLVKSTVVMKDNLAVLNERGMNPPVILGGAALTRKYVEKDLRPEYEGALFYAKDAFDGLNLLDRILAGEFQNEIPAPRVDSDESRAAATTSTATKTVAAPARSNIRRDVAIPTPPFWGARIIEKIELRAVLPYINENMLFGVQWQYRRGQRTRETYERYINNEVRPHYRKLVAQCEHENIIQPQAIYGYWPAQADGDTLIIFDPQQHDRELTRFDFPRQAKHPYWCLSDFFRPIDSGQMDVAAFTLVTAGRKVSDVARQWFAEDRYLDYLHLHGLGVETAEALAEYFHKQVRNDLAIANQDARDIQALFKQGYQGSRYSFGYPACPRLEDQLKLWPLLTPEKIGVTLSEEFQLDPEQSTTALITHHPEAKYFNVR
jgi:5-methyltetrahydrofolate--homocysteine methyltransferase